MSIVRPRIASSHVDEDLFRVPIEQVREVSLQVEADVGVFLLLGRVVMWSALDDLNVADGDAGAGKGGERRIRDKRDQCD